PRLGDDADASAWISWPLTVTPQRELESLEQRATGIVVTCRGRNRDVHTANRVDLVEIDFRKDDLLFYAHVVVATAVESATRDAAEVADARHRDADQTIEELVHR